MAQDKGQIPNFFICHTTDIVIPQTFPPMGRAYNCIHIVLSTGPIHPVRTGGQLGNDAS